MPFDLQPTLKGDLLELRPLRHEDFQPLYAVASDPLIWEQHPISDRYKKEVFEGFFREALESGGALIALESPKCPSHRIIPLSQLRPGKQ
jgi:N-acetyltransferase